MFGFFYIGRLPNTKRLNLEAVGVELDEMGAVKVDEFSRTNVPSIWAIGDVINRLNLTPVALMEGTCFSKTVFGGQPTKPDYSNVPCAVFCVPPLCVVGLSEEEAIEQAKGDILIFMSTFNPMKNAVSGDPNSKGIDPDALKTSLAARGENIELEIPCMFGLSKEAYSFHHKHLRCEGCGSL
ncbi:hypothetical protein ACSBR2_016786 [Camellia fascicularis]